MKRRGFKETPIHPTCLKYMSISTVDIIVAVEENKKSAVGTQEVPGPGLVITWNMYIHPVESPDYSNWDG